MLSLSSYFRTEIAVFPFLPGKLLMTAFWFRSVRLCSGPLVLSLPVLLCFGGRRLGTRPGLRTVEPLLLFAMSLFSVRTGGIEIQTQHRKLSRLCLCSSCFIVLLTVFGLDLLPCDGRR